MVYPSAILWNCTSYCPTLISQRSQGRGQNCWGARFGVPKVRREFSFSVLLPRLFLSLGEEMSDLNNIALNAKGNFDTPGDFQLVNFLLLREHEHGGLWLGPDQILEAIAKLGMHLQSFHCL